MRGSSALLGAMDTTVEVERDKDGRSIKVAVQKQKDAERELPMLFNLEKVADSLVLRAAVIADAGADFMVDPIIELACAMVDDSGTVQLKDLAESLARRDGVSDKTARRRINDVIPENREHAKTAADGSPVWQEPLNAANPKLGIVVRIEKRG